MNTLISFAAIPSDFAAFTVTLHEYAAFVFVSFAVTVQVPFFTPFTSPFLSTVESSYWKFSKLRILLLSQSVKLSLFHK